MVKAHDKVTLHGNPVALAGSPLEVGMAAPDFTAFDRDLHPVTRAIFAGKTCILSSVVSLDTPVCDVQMKRFNSEASKLGGGVGIIVVSMDLPFAQKRWCGAAGADNVLTLSDYRDASFGKAYGVLIKDLRLLARAVFVIDRSGVVRYREVVPEITSEPDYQAALGALKEM